MRVKSELQPGQAARGDKLTISEVLAEYLRAERGRLAPKTHARYTEVIALFTQSLNGRFIPARAGNAPRFTRSIRSSAVHPRACGERPASGFLRSVNAGSSPRVRGTLMTAASPGRCQRFIPARAGNAFE